MDHLYVRRFFLLADTGPLTLTSWYLWAHGPTLSVLWSRPPPKPLFTGPPFKVGPGLMALRAGQRLCFHLGSCPLLFVLIPGSNVKWSGRSERLASLSGANLWGFRAHSLWGAKPLVQGAPNVTGWPGEGGGLIYSKNTKALGFESTKSKGRQQIVKT